MAQQGSSGFDMSKVSTGEKIVLGGAGIYFIWSLLPFWYSFSLPDEAEALGVDFSDSVNGFRGFTLIAAILALVAIAEIIVRKVANMEMNLPMKAGLIHLGVAGVAVIGTLLGLIAKPSYGAFGVTVLDSSLAWGYFVALILSLVWAYGAFMMYQEPETAMTRSVNPPPPTTPPPGGAPPS